jgi:hypothetical protein
MLMGMLMGHSVGQVSATFFLDLKSFIYVYLSSLHLISSNVPKLSWIGLLCGTGSCLGARHFEMLRTLRGKSTEIHSEASFMAILSDVH